MDQTKKYNLPLIITIVVLAGILLAAIMYAFSAKDGEPFATKEAITEEEPSDTAPTTPSPKPANTVKTPITTGGSGQNLKADDKYKAALAKYGDLRIQMDNCQAIPVKLTVKNGTTLLLDGFSQDPQRVTIGNKTVTLEGIDAEPITIQGEPRTTLTIDCEYNGITQYNTGEIVVMP